MSVITSTAIRVVPSTVGSTAFHGHRIKWHNLLTPLLARVPDVDCLPRGIVGQAPLTKETLRLCTVLKVSINGVLLSGAWRYKRSTDVTLTCEENVHWFRRAVIRG